MATQHGEVALPPSPTPSPPAGQSPPGRQLGSGSVYGQQRRSSSLSQTRLSSHDVDGPWHQRMMRNMESLGQRSINVFLGLTLTQKIATVAALLGFGIVGILFMVFSAKIFVWLGPVAKKWHDLPGGWLLLFLMTFLTAFPPLIGYSTSLTIAGFVYGFPIGWIIVSFATVAGSWCAFIASRTLFSGYSQRLVAKDKRFAAMAMTLKHDGLKLLVMIRYCPLPYSLTNGAISTFHTVSPAMYALATALATPRIIIPVFIGGQLAELAERGEKMDSKTKAINYISIIIGAALGIGTGLFIYKRTVARARQLESMEEVQTSRPRPSEDDLERFLDDPEARIGSNDLRGADEISLHESRPSDEYHDGDDLGSEAPRGSSTFER